MRVRCNWCGEDPRYVYYHDTEWGVPVYDDQALFTLLCLESMQAGLNWFTILKKRAGFYAAFAEFDAQRLVQFTAHDQQQLCQDQRIIRHAGKIDAVLHNAARYLACQEQGSFADSLWSFTEYRVQQHRYCMGERLPATTPEAIAMSAWLKAQGFKFVGDKICYALMQAAGMVNDHVQECFRYRELGGGG